MPHSPSTVPTRRSIGINTTDTHTYFELEVFLALFFAGGTFAPDLRASDNPIAIACFGLVTLRPEPLFSFPFLNSCISRSTLADDLGLYLLPLDFLWLEDFVFALTDFVDEDFFAAVLMDADFFAVGMLRS